MTTSGPGDLSRHPDLAGVGAAMRSEWATEQHDAIADAQEQFEHNQTFTDWLTDAMHAGDRLAVTVVDQRFTGTVEEIGPDLLGMRCIFGRVDIHLALGVTLQIELVDHPASGGHRGNIDTSFAAVIAGRDPHADTSVGTLYVPEGLDGLVTPGRDFVRIKARAGAETVVPMQQIAWVCNRRV
jgi:hypothetical protein